MARIHRSQVSTLLLLVGLLCQLFVASCKSTAPDSPETKDTASLTQEVTQIEIPVLPTATEQLAFARSSMLELQVKKAALTAVSLFHPDALAEHKIAALELAYLELGTDYRLATPAQCRAAISSYEKIYEDNKNEATIAAKALWYLGWIHSSLLADPQGEDFYKRITTDYPLATVEFLPPPPWLSLKDNDRELKSPAPSTPQYLWADLAYLELIRIARHPEQAISIINQLKAERPDHPLLGRMVKTLLMTHGVTSSTRAIASEVLINTSIADNNRAEISALLASEQQEPTQEEMR